MDFTSVKDHTTYFAKIRMRRKLCIGISIFILFVLTLTILGFTVFRAKHAVTTVNSVKLKGLKTALDIPNMGIDLNVTLDMDLSVNNPNHASFKYGNSSALLFYRGILVGEAEIPAGEILSEETLEMNVTLTVMADRLLSNSGVYYDVRLGKLPLQTTTRISGKVTILGLVRHHLVSYSYCDLLINVWNQTVGNSECRYKTQL